MLLLRRHRLNWFHADLGFTIIWFLKHRAANIPYWMLLEHNYFLDTYFCKDRQKDTQTSEKKERERERVDKDRQSRHLQKRYIKRERERERERGLHD